MVNANVEPSSTVSVEDSSFGVTSALLTVMVGALRVLATVTLSATSAPLVDMVELPASISRVSRRSPTVTLLVVMVIMLLP
jgi:hypothetical protein